jgi:hypothetical protein
MTMGITVNLSLTPEDLNLILVALSHLPYRQVHELIERIQKDAGPQLLAAVQHEQATVSQEAQLS